MNEGYIGISKATAVWSVINVAISFQFCPLILIIYLLCLGCVFKEYQNSFHKTKQKLEQNPAERQFDLSEMYIFGKFETFYRRLLKIIHIFDTITTYSVLLTSKMEGLEVMAAKYQVCTLSALIHVINSGCGSK